MGIQRLSTRLLGADSDSPRLGSDQGTLVDLLTVTVQDHQACLRLQLSRQFTRRIIPGVGPTM